MAKITEKVAYEILPFESPKEFNSWMKKNHDSTPGVWIKMAKKGTGIPSIDHPGALDEALCYGWIDGQAKSIDEKFYLQKFTPRRSKSMWSNINREKVQRLIDEGRMMPAGLAEIESAKADGRWNAAYDSPKNMVMPEDFIKLVNANKKAKAFFDTLNKTNLYAIGWRLQTAKKSETREKRMKVILEMLERGEAFH
ncbi:MAG: YdeI/OmpD-associated family protein [bacterium]|nr:YdeI/OmpD-associated family protein [bacterium]